MQQLRHHWRHVLPTSEPRLESWLCSQVQLALKSLPPTWETCTEFMTPSFSLAQPCCGKHLGNQCGGELFLYVFFCLLKKFWLKTIEQPSFVTYTGIHWLYRPVYRELWHNVCLFWCKLPALGISFSVKYWKIPKNNITTTTKRDTWPDQRPFASYTKHKVFTFAVSLLLVFIYVFSSSSFWPLWVSTTPDFHPDCFELMPWNFLLVPLPRYPFFDVT